MKEEQTESYMRALRAWIGAGERNKEMALYWLKKSIKERPPKVEKEK